MDANTRIIEYLDRIETNCHAISSLNKEISAIKSRVSKETQAQLNKQTKEHTETLNRMAYDVKIGDGFIPRFVKKIDDTSGLNTFEDVETWIRNNKDLFVDVNSKAFINGIKQFDEEFWAFFNQKNEFESNFCQEAARIRAEGERTLENEITPIFQEIERLKTESEGFDVLHEDYYYLAGDISKILKTRRAGDVTEALNLAIKEADEANYRNMQLIIQSEEARRRNRILQEQVEEEARNNKMMQQMEYERMEEARKYQASMLAAVKEANAMQERRYDDEKRAAEKAERQRDRKKAELLRELDTATSHWRNYKSAGLTQDAIRMEAKIERIKGELLSYN